MRARKIAIRLGQLALIVFFAGFFLSCQDITWSAICRGDSVSTADCDTCLVSCRVIERDSLVPSP